jgi:hypothetical protein
MSTRADDLALLDDYMSGQMDDVAAAAFEERLFQAAAEARAPELRFADDLTATATWFQMRGGFAVGTTLAQIEELRALPRVHYIDLRSGVPIEAWPNDTEYVVYRVGVGQDLRPYELVDVEILTPEGEHLKHFRDVQCDPSDGQLYGVCDAPLALGVFRSRPLVARVEGMRQGRRELLATMQILPAE